ncbi:MAG: lysophospholipid acyltransferase family protein [Planctomycetota bacterium]
MLRLGWTLLWTLVLAILWFAGSPVARLFRRWRGWRSFVFRNWARACLRGIGAHVTVRGAPPRTAGYLVTNHLSYVDVIALAAHVDGVFLSMAEIARWPFLGRMARSFGTLFIERDKKRTLPDVIDALESALARGEIVIFFPEGTNTHGDAVHPFRPALFEPAASRDRAVAYATLRYATHPPDPPASRAVSWVDTPLFAHATQLLALRRIDVEIVFGAEPVRARNRKALADELRRRVASAFVPME